MKQFETPVIVRASNDLLWTDEGEVLIDLFSAYGANWLGHCHPRITRALTEQLSMPWSLGGLRHQAAVDAHAALARYCPEGLYPGGLYSTGMEAAEFAMRVARAHTGRNAIIGFERSMHGKSAATATLAWDNGDGFSLPHCRRLPFVDTASEADLLANIQGQLEIGDVGALFLETLQGSNGALEASPAFYQAMGKLLHDHDVLLVADEILTGFYRTGPRFRFELAALQPDIVLIGKGCGAGFPVAGLLVRDEIVISPAMLPGSTYSGNPLACAAVAATLSVLDELDVVRMVTDIGQRVEHYLSGASGGARLRGGGALWMLEFASPQVTAHIVRQCYQGGVSVGFSGRHLRLLPAVTIEPGNLERACLIIAQILKRSC